MRKSLKNKSIIFERMNSCFDKLDCGYSMFSLSLIHNKCLPSKYCSLSDDANADSQDSIVQDIETKIKQTKEQNAQLKLKMKQMRQCQKSKEQFIKNAMQSLGFISKTPNQLTLNQTSYINTLMNAISVLEKQKTDAEAQFNSMLENDQLWKSQEMEADAINLYEESSRLNDEKLREQQFFNSITQNIDHANNLLQNSIGQKQEIKKLKQEINQLEQQINSLLQNNQKRVPKSYLKQDILQSQILHFESTLTAETISSNKSQEIIQEGCTAMNEAIKSSVIRLREALDSMNDQ